MNLHTLQERFDALSDELRRDGALGRCERHELVALLFGMTAGFLYRSHAHAGRVHVRFTIGPISGEHMALIIKATDEPKTLRVAFKDAEGNPAKVDGVPQWGVSDGAVGTLTPSEDGMSCTFNPGSPITGQINVTADADLGAGNVPVTGVLDVEVIPGDAVTAEISVE